MELNIFKSAAWQLIMQTDWMCKFILISLFLLSVYCVAIIALKYVSAARQRTLMREFLQQFHQARSMTELMEVCKNVPESLGSKLVLRLFAEMQRMKRQSAESSLGMVLAIDQDQQSYLEVLTGQHISSLILEEERYLPLLGSSAAVSPLIGLFGTIWGLIHAFLDISKEKSADIATVAPGIAEALITTLAGLVVAIPAMIAFHYFSHEMRKLEGQLIDIGETVLALAAQRIER